jgi:hypothetical protein
LLKNGVPFRLAFGFEPDHLDAVERATIDIIFGELDGGSFDWHTMAFKDST